MTTLTEKFAANVRALPTGWYLKNVSRQSNHDDKRYYEVTKNILMNGQPQTNAKWICRS